jgi:hypothetical protein
LQARALKEGIPYQTLISSVLHKFVDGQLIDKVTKWLYRKTYAGILVAVGKNNEQFHRVAK